MKATSIFITLAGIAISIICLVYFRPALNVADSDTMTVNSHGIRTAEWPLFIGILTTFVGIVFYFIAATAKKK